MKNKILIYTMLFSALFVGVMSCDKDSNVQTSFPFTLTYSAPDSSIVNFKQETSFSINTDRVVSSNSYYFKYEVVQGNGSYYFLDSTPVPQNERIELPNRLPKFLYASPKIGTEKVNVIIEDTQSQEAVQLDYNVVHNPFTIELNSPTNQAKVNEPKPFSFSLFNTGPDKSVTYEKAFYILQGSGQLFEEDGLTEIPLETFQATEEGAFNFNISFDDFGDSKLVVATKDSNQQIKNDTISFQVSAVDVTFIAATDSNNAFLGQTFNLNFNVSEDQGEGGQYQLRYEVVKGAANILSNENKLNPGLLYDIDLGSFSWQAIGTQNGPLEITFTLRNELGVEISKTLTITIIEAGMIFDAVPLASEITLGNSVSFNASIDESPNAQPPYTLKFTTSASGTVTYNGQEYTPGQTIDVDEADFSFDYDPLVAGQHSLEFTATNSIPIQALDQVSILVQDPSMDFQAVPVSNQVVLGSTLAFNASIQESPDAAPPYKMTFTTSGSGTVIFNNQEYSPGQTIDIPDADFNFLYNPLTSGQQTLTFTATNSIDIEDEHQMNIDVLQPTLSFNAFAQISQALLNESINFTASIQETPQNYPPYNLKFSSSGTGKLIFDNIEYNPGENIVVPDADFNFQYRGESLGDHEITLILDNQIPLQAQDVVDVTFKNADFNFSAAPNNNVVETFSTESIVIDIDDLNDQQNFQIKFLNNMGNFTLKQNGQTRNPGVFYDISSGLSNWEITPNAPGDINIDFVVRNNFGVEKIQSIHIDATIPDFNVSLNYDNLTLTWKENVDIQLDLDGTENMDYFIEYAISPNDGSNLLKNNNVLAQNSQIQPGKSYLDFEFVGAGQYSIDFTITTNFNTVKQASASFTVQNTPIDFTVEFYANSGTSGFPSLFKFERLSTGYNTIEYTLTRSVLVGQGDFDFPNNIQDWNFQVKNQSYTPTVPGQHTIRLTLTDNYGYSKTVDTVFQVNN